MIILHLSYTMAVSFIGGGNQSTLRKAPTCHKSLTNFITYNFDAVFFSLNWLNREVIVLCGRISSVSYRYRVKSTEKGQQAEFLNLNIFILHPILNMHI
jgi:hypothetical protein